MQESTIKHSTQWRGYGSDAAYEQRIKDTAKAVAFSTSLATLKATWKMMRDRKAVSARLAQPTHTVLPKSKGVKRYRVMAALGRQARMAPAKGKRVVPTNVTTAAAHLNGKRLGDASAWIPGSIQEAQFRRHVTAQCDGRHDIAEFGAGAVTGMPIHNKDLPVCGDTVIGVQVCHPASEHMVVDATVVGSRNYQLPLVRGHKNKPY